MTTPEARSALEYERFTEAVGLNWYEADPNLHRVIERYVPRDDVAWAHERLQQAGAVIGGPVARRAEVTDRHPPRLQRYDRWGTDVGQVVHHPGALDTKRDLFEIHRSLERPGRRAPSAVSQAVSYMLSQAETGMLCAIGMTGGVAGLVDAYAPREIRELLMPHLRPERFEDLWDGAMFLTERAGGSDVGRGTETVATPADADGTVWRLNGFKWFCSNLDAGAVATLARPAGAPEGSRGLALFLVPRQRLDGTPNGIRILRLKDKLGTKAVPTGEVDLVDAEAYLLSGPRGDGEPDAATDGRGLGRMMGMVQGSRMGVAVMGLGIMRRSFLDAAIYAAHRRAFGNRIDAFPLVRETLARMAMEVEAGTALCFEAATAPERGDRDMWRILVPLAKYRCARRGVQLASACVEVHGGNGYIEDWPAARQLRDAQCHTIWEGTENIVCLDVERAVSRDGALEPLLGRVDRAVESATHPCVAPVVDAVRRGRGAAERAGRFMAGAPKDVAQLNARRFTSLLADLAQAALLCEEAQLELESSGSARKAAVATLFAQVRLDDRPLRGIGEESRIVLDLFDPIVRYGEVEPAALVRV